MATQSGDPEFDVVIIGAGVAGALAAYKLSKLRYRVLILEAGGNAPSRSVMVENYLASATKSPDSPFCGKNVLAPQPDPLANGKNYYDYDARLSNDMFKSYYERLVGGATWHWQGLYLRMLPNDFKTKSLYGVGLDWPLTYSELEPWYVEAEYELGVAGSDREVEDFFKPRFGAFRSKPFPMAELVPSYLDTQIAKAIRGKQLDGIPLRLTTVPHATNSRPYDGRPACNGHTSCVPMCPIRARYDALVHVEKALAQGTVLRTQCVVSRLEPDSARKQVSKVWYKVWTSDKSGKPVPSATEQSVTGRIVILAANGMENPMVLLRSGVGNTSDAVGRHLMDHPIKQSFGLAVQPLYPFRGPQTTSDIEGFRDGTFRRSYAAFKTSLKNDGWSSTPTLSPLGFTAVSGLGQRDNMPGTILDFVGNWKYFGSKLRDTVAGHTIRQITLNSACEQLPSPDNRVTLSKNKDALGFQRPLIQYRLEDDGEYVTRSFRKMIELHEKIFDALSVKREDRFMQNDGTKTYGGSGHIMGTTLMGQDPRWSVVDSNCRSHDLANLYVLGSSVFPTSSTANSTSTLAALALRAANTIDKRLRARE